jgi:hypothetical protein
MVAIWELFMGGTTGWLKRTGEPPALPAAAAVEEPAEPELLTVAVDPPDPPPAGPPPPVGPPLSPGGVDDAWSLPADDCDDVPDWVEPPAEVLARGAEFTAVGLEVTAAEPLVEPPWPDVATGLLTAVAVAGPVLPVFVAVEEALESPELPELAVGWESTVEPPPEPPVDPPLPVLDPPVLVWANAGEANRTRAATAPTAPSRANHPVADLRIGSSLER